MGGQTAADDFHRALFDEAKLKRPLRRRLVLLRPWISEVEDCAAIRSPEPRRLQALCAGARRLRAMSVPRLAFMDNMFCAMEAVLALHVKFRKHGGAFWGQSLSNVFERILAEDQADLILTVDYDSIFSPKHLATLIQLMMLHPEIDALAPIQSRGTSRPPLHRARRGWQRTVVRRADLAADTFRSTRRTSG